MKNQYLLFAIALIFLFAIPMATAETLGTFKQNGCVNLIQTCSNCTYSNITSVVYPNSSIALSDKTMTKTGTYFNYTFCNTSSNGIYIVTGVGDPDGTAEAWNYDFEITNDGKEKSPVNFIAIIAGLLGVCILCFALSKILKAKPLKILFLFVGMIMMLFILSTANLMLLSSDGSVSTSNIHENLGMPYTILMWSIIFTFLYFIVTYFIDTLKDMQTKKKIDRGDMEDEE